MNLFDLLDEREEWRRSLTERLNRETKVVSEVVTAERRSEAEALVDDELTRERELRIADAVERLRKAEEA